MIENNYVGIAHDYYNDKLMVWERPITGGPRNLKIEDPPRYFYINDPNGTYLSIFDEPLTRINAANKDEFKKLTVKYRKKYESDIQPLYKFLMDNYYNRKTPIIHYAFLDIEVDYKMPKFQLNTEINCIINNEEVVLTVEDLRSIKLEDLMQVKVWSSKKADWVNSTDSEYLSEGITGFPRPKNPYARINAVTIYQSWTNQYVTIAIPPDGWTGHDTFDKDIKRYEKKFKIKNSPKIHLVTSEKELLQIMLRELEDSDIISGWNSEFFDIPYIVERLRILGGEKFTSKLCFPGAPKPKQKEVDRFGTLEMVYELFGRTHLDYLDLVKKFTFEGRTSYSLANIAADELDTPKLEYEGTLENLYTGMHEPKRLCNNIEEALAIEDERLRNCMLRSLAGYDLKQTRNKKKKKYFLDLSKDDLQTFYKDVNSQAINISFVIFVAYNFRDVEVIKELNDKFRFIELVNQMAHENTCLFSALMGTVKYVETGIVNRAHYEYGKIVPDLNMSKELNKKVEGAIVLTPRKGVWKWIGSIDIRSLYPNCIIMLNMSIETFLGQFVNNEQDWHEIMNLRSNNQFTFITREGEMIEASGEEWRKYIKENNYTISAFGSMFDQNKPGILSSTLEYWFKERKRLQAEKKKYEKELNVFLEKHGLEIPLSLFESLQS